MPKIRIGLIQASAGPDPAKNLEKTIKLAKEAIRRGSQLICLQELFSSPYFPRVHDANVDRYAENIPGHTTEAFASLAREHGIVAIVPIFEKGAGEHFFNTAVILHPDGTIGGIYRKVHIPQDPFYFEKEYFTPGVGYVVNDTPFGRVAVLICYDQWFPEAARAVSLMGAQIIFYPTALGEIGSTGDTLEGDWEVAWQTVQRGHAIANGVHVAAVNRVGSEGNLTFFGGSFVCDAFGNVVAKAGRAEGALVAEVDLSMNDLVREGWGFFSNRRPDTYWPLVERAGMPVMGTPRMAGFRMPAEWEPHQGIWLSWPHDNGTFSDIPAVEETYLGMIHALQGKERIYLLVRDAEMRSRLSDLLSARGIGAYGVKFHVHPYADVWFRDYGPIFLVHRQDPLMAAVNWKFNAWGRKYPELEEDDAIAPMIAWALHIPLYSPGMVLEGGSIDVDGLGTLMTTEQCLLNPNRNPHLARDQIEHTLAEYLGVSRFIWLRGGIAGDDTDGHIDDVARFADPWTVVCALEGERQSEQSRVLHENFRILKGSTAYDGSPLRVIPLPMPEPRDDPMPASYTNFYIGNGTVLVPTFDDPADRPALQILEKVFPGRRVVGIDCKEMIRGMGAIHCVSQQYPSL